MPLRVRVKYVSNDHCRVCNVVLTCTRRLHTSTSRIVNRTVGGGSIIFPSMTLRRTPDQRHRLMQ
jgi:hypothetical protein